MSAYNLVKVVATYAQPWLESLYYTGGQHCTFVHLVLGKNVSQSMHCKPGRVCPMS